MSTKTIRNIREPLKKPRPLKSVSTEQIKFHAADPKDSVIQKSRDEILADLEILNVSISNCSFDEVTVMDIARMCAILKKRGEELDTYHREAVDRFFCTLRNASREERLDMISRVKLLETIELRARNWKRNDNINNYFNAKILELEQKSNEGYNYSSVTSPTIPFPVPNQNLSSTPVPLAPGEILRSSGKFEKPTKIAGKNLYKDEIVIRNSDSGKVMGIKGRRVRVIEELSDCVISFQRVNPGARDRLVQITGPHEESIGHAKLLVEDTIRRNASPLRDNTELSGFENREPVDFGNVYQSMDNQPYMKKSLQHSYSMGDASLREYSYSLEVGQEFVTLTGTNAELLKTAKSVLKEFFAGQPEFHEKHENLNRHSSPEYNVPRFELRRQSSLKSNLESNYSAAWRNHTLKQDSPSPFSSSDDDIERLEKNGPERDFPSHNFDIHNNGKFRNSESIESSSDVHITKFTRSSSVPCDSLQAVTTFPEIEPIQNDEVFSPLMSPVPDSAPIPPPSYKPLKYSREFLLQCAKSPFSHNQPPNFPHIHQIWKEIVCESPVMFDPEKYEESRLEETTVCVLK